MGKRTGLDYPKLDNETIKVTDFLNLKSATMKTGKITVLIGEQAVGKSILAKVQYFFWKYQSDLFEEEALAKESIASYNKKQVDSFFELFAVTTKNAKPFEIKYTSNDIEICLARKSGGHKPKITTSPFLKNLHVKAKKARKDYIEYSKEERVYYRISEKKSKEETMKERKKYEKRRRNYRLLGRKIDKFLADVPDVLYVPASRSFFSTIEDNVFAFLAKGRESLDPLIVQFGEFYELAKRIYQKPSGRRMERIAGQGADIINNVLKGEFIRDDNDKDFIRATWGDVELRQASSGQKESLPLILSLLYFPYFKQAFRQTFRQRFRPSFGYFSGKNRNQLIIIEEPEAHLFPTAQKRILEETVRVVQDMGCSVLLATHSPYVPTCINNEIQIALNKEKPLDVKAYQVSKGRAKNIYLKKENMIDTDQIDSVSEELMSEYYDALKESGSLENDK